MSDKSFKVQSLYKITSRRNDLEKNGILLSFENTILQLQVLSSLIPADTRKEWYDITNTKDSPGLSKYFVLPKHHGTGQVLSKNLDYKFKFYNFAGRRSSEPNNADFLGSPFLLDSYVCV